MYRLALSLLLLTACADTTTTAPASTAGEVVAAPALETFTSDSAGFDTHSFWLDTGREVVVFDAQFTPDYARRLISAIAARTKSPIRWVVVTHPNPDKFNGAAAFQAVGAKVVASEATARAIPAVHAYKKAYFVDVAKSFTEATYPAEAKIDVTFSGDWALPLEGSARVLLHELVHPGVASTQTVAYLPQQNALVVGDLVHVKAHAWLEGPIRAGKPAPDLASWKLALDELRSYSGSTVYGGRGGVAPVEEAVATEQDYLDRMNALVHRYVAGLSGAAPSTDAITAEAVKELPDYTLPYMISYGVYGLLDQVLSER